MKQSESSKGRPKILDYAAFADFRYQFDGTKDICKLRVLFNKSASKSAIRSGKCIVGETFIRSASSFDKYHSAVSGSATLDQITTQARDREEKDPRNLFT